VKNVLYHIGFFAIFMLTLCISYAYSSTNPTGTYDPKDTAYYEPGSFKITNMSAIYQKTPTFSAFMIMGFVHNLSNETGSPSIMVQAFDKNNTLIDTAMRSALLHNLLPGDKSPFKIPLFTNVSDFDHYYLRIVGPMLR
jgi:hypothetical protein